MSLSQQSCTLHFSGQKLVFSTPAVQKAHNILCKFVLIGWGIYPLGYMIGTSGWYDFVDVLPLNMDVVYNIGDAINKIGFGLVVYNLAVSSK